MSVETEYIGGKANTVAPIHNSHSVASFYGPILSTKF